MIGRGGRVVVVGGCRGGRKRKLGGKWMVVQWFGTATNWMEKEVIVVG